MTITLLSVGLSAGISLSLLLLPTGTARTDVLAGTMRGYAATSANCATQGYSDSLRTPTLGDLRASYAGLPAGACEVLVNVAASSINPSDMHPTVAPGAGLPHVMGSDLAGTVLRVDPGCNATVRVGDRVWGDIGANTHARLSGARTKELGGYAEIAVALDTQLGRMPRNMGFVEAAALPKVALTSWKALTWYAGALNATFRGRRVLVLGGSGGTGSTGIQIARALGAGEILTTTSAANAAYVERLGANRSIDYHVENWWDTSVIEPDSVDVVYDCVGQPDTGDRAMGVLRSGGFYVTITGQLATHVKQGVRQHMFINSDTNLDSHVLLDALRDLAEKDALRMRRIAHIYALNTIPDAFAQSKAGHVVGKIVVNVTAQIETKKADFQAAGGPAYDYDLAVYGSSPAGVAAAVAAGRLGLRVGLFEPLPMIGGMGAAGNLALNDGGNGAEHTGLALEFSRENARHYGLPNSSVVAHPESFVAEATFYKLLAGAGVSDIFLDCRLTAATTTTATAESTPSKIRDMTVFCKDNPVRARVFIDASYDGELMVAAKNIDFTFGREAISTYGESLAGARKPGFVGVSGPQHVSALHDDGKTLLKYVQNMTKDALPAPGEADDALMAFQHRLCLTDKPDNRITWPKPPGYDPSDFLLLQRTMEASGNNTDFFTRLPPASLASYGVPAEYKKYCLCCGISIFSTDQPMLNKGWANASWERKQEIIEDHTYFELGSFYYLSNDPKVPETVRSKFSRFGLCKDEFAAFDHIPPQLYVRISNRMVGDFVLTQNNLARPQTKDDSIAVGDWSFDEHMTGKYAVDVGGGKWEVQLEGNFWPQITPTPGNQSDHRKASNWYDLPFRAIVPKRGTGANLLVPVALSASAVAFSSTRIENMYMSVGTAAGVAAAQIVENGGDGLVQDVNVTEIQRVLVDVFRQRVHGPPKVSK